MPRVRRFMKVWLDDVRGAPALLRSGEVTEVSLDHGARDPSSLFEPGRLAQDEAGYYVDPAAQSWPVDDCSAGESRIRGCRQAVPTVGDRSCGLFSDSWFRLPSVSQRGSSRMRRDRIAATKESGRSVVCFLHSSYSGRSASTRHPTQP